MSASKESDATGSTAMENLSRRTMASLFAAFLIFAVGFAATIDLIGKPNAATAHCDSHLHFVQTNG
jgi:hypothetical protein